LGAKWLKKVSGKFGVIIYMFKSIILISILQLELHKQPVGFWFKYDYHRELRETVP